MHTKLGGCKSKAALKDKGKRTIYNPGFATSVLGFLPIAIAYLYSFTLKTPTVLEGVLSFVIFVALGILCIPGMESLFKNENSKFPYDWGYGYFNRYHFK